jgi:hypothetical protein
MSIPHVLLGLLLAGKKHGYELKREYDGRFPLAKPLAFGQVYSTLERPRCDHLVTTAGVGRASGPDRTYFAITSTAVASSPAGSWPPKRPRRTSAARCSPSSPLRCSPERLKEIALELDLTGFCAPSGSPTLKGGW